MTKDEWLFVLRRPEPDLVALAVSYVSLTVKERQLVRFRGQEGMTQEETAEEMGVDRRTLQRLEKTTYKKMASVWAGHPFIVAYMTKALT